MNSANRNIAIFNAIIAVTGGVVSGSTYTGATNGEWGTAGNWSGGVPNAADAVADINTALTVNVSDTGTGGAYPYTFGTLGTTIGSGSVVVGSTSVTTDILTAATTTGVPTINVGNSGGSIFFYANLLGTQGFQKTGAGKFTFRFNGSDQSYSGPIAIQGGILGINQAGSLGDAGNDVTIANGARLLFEPGNNSGTHTLGSGHAFTLTGAQSQLGANNVNVTGVIQGSVSGVGGLTKTDAGRINLDGAVSYQGDTRVVGGILDFNSGTFSTTANVLVQGGPGTQLDLSDLSAFTLTGVTKTFIAQPTTTSSGTHTAEAVLSKTLNTITAASVTAGGASGTSQGSSNTGAIRFGESNTINADTINIGGFNGRGEITLQAGLTAPSVTLRGTDATSPVSNINIGATSSGTRSGEGVFTLSGATVDVLATNITIGQHIAGSTNLSTSVFSFDAGTVAADALVLGNRTNTNTGDPTIDTSFNQGGGTASLKLISFGRNDNGASAPVFRSYLNLAGGTLRSQTIEAGAGAFASTSVRRIGWTGGTIANFDASTDLSINGVAGTGGQLLLALSGAAPKSFDASAGRTITVGSQTNITGTGVALAKTGLGTLLLNGPVAPDIDVDQGALGGTGALAGAVNVDAGAVIAPGNSIGTLAVGSAVIAGTLAVEWQDVGAGTADGSVDLLAVTNTLNITLASLQITDFNGSSVANDDAYVLATYGSLVGASFANTTGVPSGYEVDYDYNGNSIALVPIPEPTALALVGLAMLPAMRRRGR